MLPETYFQYDRLPIRHFYPEITLMRCPGKRNVYAYVMPTWNTCVRMRACIIHDRGATIVQIEELYTELCHNNQSTQKTKLYTKCLPERRIFTTWKIAKMVIIFNLQEYTTKSDISLSCSV